MQRRAPHAPFPEAGGEGQEIDGVARVGNEAVRKGLMGSAVEGLQKEKTLAMRHTTSFCGLLRGLLSIGKGRVAMRAGGAGFHTTPKKLLTGKTKTFIFEIQQRWEMTMQQIGIMAGMFFGRFFFSFRSVHPAL